jgi:hypothetical protein
MLPLLAISAIMSAAGSIGGMFSSASSSKKLDQMLKKDPKYKANPLAAQRLGMAQTLLNARMPGATTMERNIYGNQANQLSNVSRNATDGSQALALGSAAIGQSNQAFQNLGVQEQQDYYNRLQNLNAAQQGVMAETDKVHADEVRRFGDQAAVTGAKMQNTQTMWNSLTNLGISGMNLGMQMQNQNTNTGAGQKQQTPVIPTVAAPARSFMGMTPAQTMAKPATNNNAPGWINPYSAQGGVPMSAYPPWMQNPYNAQIQ